jgi:hypothetical protein
VRLADAATGAEDGRPQGARPAGPAGRRPALDTRVRELGTREPARSPHAPRASSGSLLLVRFCRTLVRYWSGVRGLPDQAKPPIYLRFRPRWSDWSGFPQIEEAPGRSGPSGGVDGWGNRIYRLLTHLLTKRAGKDPTGRHSMKSPHSKSAAQRPFSGVSTTSRSVAGGASKPVRRRESVGGFDSRPPPLFGGLSSQDRLAPRALAGILVGLISPSSGQFLARGRRMPALKGSKYTGTHCQKGLSSPAPSEASAGSRWPRLAQPACEGSRQGCHRCLRIG